METGVHTKNATLYVEITILSDESESQSKFLECRTHENYSPLHFYTLSFCPMDTWLDLLSARSLGISLREPIYSRYMRRRAVQWNNNYNVLGGQLSF